MIVSRPIKFRALDKETGFFLPNDAINALLEGDKVAGQMPPVIETEEVEKEVQTSSYDGLIVKDIPVYSRYTELIEREVEQPIETLQGNPFTMERLELMQFTGLLDKNGVEIYEGDLLKHHSSELLSEVIFNDGTFWMKNIMWDNPLGRMNDQLEVIGNIYENPELLTPTKENLSQEGLTPKKDGK